MKKEKITNNQVVMLLVGKNTQLKQQIVNKLVKEYFLQDVLSIIDPLRNLCSASLGISLPIFNSEELKNKAINPPMVMVPSKMSKLVLTFREMLPKNHPFNPYTVGEGKYNLGPFTSPKHAILEIGNKFANSIMPSFCSTLTYANLEAKYGFYLITGIRKQSEIQLAQNLFQNVISININDFSEIDKQFMDYDSEKSLQNIKTDFTISSIEELTNIVKKIKLNNEPIKGMSKEAESLTKNKSVLPSNVKTGGENNRFVYEHKDSLPSHADTVVWLKPLNK